MGVLERVSMDRFLEVEGAHVVRTTRCRLAEMNLTAAIKHRRITMFSGLPGMGKSVAAAAAGAAIAPNASIYLSLTSRSNPAMLARELVIRATGVEKTRGTRWYSGSVLQRELEIVSSDHGTCLITIDEAQNLSLACIEWLRWLHFETNRIFAVLLVGGPQLPDSLSKSPQLMRRIYRPTKFSATPRDEVVDFLRAYHDIYAKSDEALLLRLDDRRHKGNLGAWMNFTMSAHDRCRAIGRDTVTEDVARYVLRLDDQSQL